MITTKEFKFKKGTIDWKTWIKASHFISDFFIKKRRGSAYREVELKTDYKITVTIESIRVKRKVKL